MLMIFKKHVRNHRLKSVNESLYPSFFAFLFKFTYALFFGFDVPSQIETSRSRKLSDQFVLKKFWLEDKLAKMFFIKFTSK